MSILRAEAIPVSVPFEIGGPKPTFAGVPRQMDILLIRIETDRGLVGWGEAFGYGIWPATRQAFEKLVAPAVIGKDEADIAGISESLQRLLHILGRGGAGMYAISGLDIALWDIAGKAAGKSLGALLGGAKHQSLPLYASLMRYGNADLVARNTAEALKRGYRAIKLHEVGSQMVRAARQAMGAGPALMMDVNCPWTVAKSLAMADEVRDCDLLWLEEPVWPPEDFAGLAQVRRQCGIKIAAGENNMSAPHFAQMFDAGAVDFAQPSVTKIGGVTEFMKVVALATQHDVAVMPHSPYFGPGLLATLHIMSTFAQETMVEYSFADLGASPMGDSIAIHNGRIAVPQGPGLGRDPDMAVVERHRVA
jgi:L-alanine-DL-glutamate epimerase-like enolase superfamily enzyme